MTLRRLSNNLGSLALPVVRHALRSHAPVSFDGGSEVACKRSCLLQKKAGQQSIVSSSRVSAEEPATNSDSTFVTDCWDVWAIRVLRHAVDLNMFITKVTAPRIRAVQQKWLVLRRGVCHLAQRTGDNHMRGQLRCQFVMLPTGLTFC